MKIFNLHVICEHWINFKFFVKNEHRMTTIERIAYLNNMIATDECMDQYFWHMTCDSDITKRRKMDMLSYLEGNTDGHHGEQWLG